MLFERRMYPYSEEFVAKDYFPETNTSLFGKIRRQGLFSRDECIPIRRNSSPGIIFPRRMHPYTEKFVARDYFPEANASLFGKIRCQGLLFHGKCIPDRVFLQIRMHSSGKHIVLQSKHPSREQILPHNHFSAFTRSFFHFPEIFPEIFPPRLYLR